MILAVVGAIVGGSSNKKNSSTTSTAAAVPTKARHRTHRRKRHVAPSYTGFGATRTAWNAGHTGDPRYAHDAVYNADPNVPDGTQYVAMQWTTNHVTAYEQHLRAEPISEAKADVLAEFPRDTHTMWFVTKGSNCAMQMVKSRALGRLLSGKAIGDGQGTALIEYSSDQQDGSYNASSVNDALVSIFPAEPASKSEAC
jgi:hypothetical protein